MKISIITVCYNAASTIENTIKSVLNQSYKDIEYIVIDGNSKDTTLQIIKRYKKSIEKIISENDLGIYDAMNKGINLASGQVIGILNADDVYIDEYVIEKKMSILMSKDNISGCYSNLIYFSKNKNKIIRNWVSEKLSYEKIKYGWTIPHPTLFLRKSVYKKYGNYDIKFGNAADYEFILRIISDRKIYLEYLEIYSVKMLLGGASNNSMKGILKQNIQIIKALDKYNINYSKFNFIIQKLFNKLKQYL